MAHTIPTRYVRVLATGHECLINAEDFDARVHAPIQAEPAQPAAAPATAPNDPVPIDTSIHALNVDQARARIKQAATLAELDALERGEAEHPRHAGGRASLVAAFSEQRSAIMKADAQAPAQ